jgi:tRNA-dihydrouridine synthase
MYEGTVDLDMFETACNLSVHRIVYNGDITCLDDFQRLSKRFVHIDRWMIGRGVLTDPFLPATIKKGGEIDVDKIGVLKRYHDAYYRERLGTLSGPVHVMDRMKSFWSYLAPSLERGDHLFKTIKKLRETGLYEQRIDEFFSEGTQWKGPFSAMKGGCEHP